MSSTTNKQQSINQILNLLKKHFNSPELEKRPVLEELLYGVLREGATRPQADKAYRTLQERFFDWNEVRVSAPQEVAEAIADLPDATVKSERLIGILQEVFETTYSFRLDDIDKKGVKNAAKQLGRMEDVNDYAVAWVLQQALNGHALPLDTPSLRALRRLGLIEEEVGDLEVLRGSLEHQIPKAKGTLFLEGISEVAKEYCWEENPHCSACPLKGECPTGQARPQNETRSARMKPR
jgi:endonuclease III